MAQPITAKLSQALKLIIIVSASFGVLVCLGLFILAQVVFKPPAEITDVSRYTEIHNQYWHPKLVRHFPENIPVNATDVRMAYLPSFLQGGAYFQLKLKLPADEIDDLLHGFSTTAA